MDNLSASVPGMDVSAIFAFVLPGFVGLAVWRLVEPRHRRPFKDHLFEAATFGAVTYASFGYWMWLMASDPERQLWMRALTLFGAVCVVPTVFAILARGALTVAERMRWVAQGSRTSWDFVFSQRKPLWVSVQLKDGRRVTGLFGARSFASSDVDPGHLFLENTLVEPEDGGEKEFSGWGVLVSSGDYDIIEVAEVQDGEYVQG